MRVYVSGNGEVGVVRGPLSKQLRTQPTNAWASVAPDQLQILSSIR